MKRLLLVALVVGIMSMGTAQADIIVYEFEGTFQISTAPGISVGDTFSGTLAYDNNATLEYLGEDFSEFSSNLAEITMTANGLTYQTSTPLTHWVENDYDWLYPVSMVPIGNYDDLILLGGITPLGVFTSDPAMGLALVDIDRTVFGVYNSVLPSSLSLGSLGDFEYIEFAITNWGDPDIYAIGLITSFEPVAVPEPSTMLLLGSGLLGLWGFRKKFKK